MKTTNSVQEHYSISGMSERINNALLDAGLESGSIELSQLSPLDQFHVRGLEATEELARGLNLTSDATVIDVGCGLGGPARYLAATYGCQVTGIDLSQPFVEVASMLAARTGLSSHTEFVQGDALDLPFPAAHFDYAWTQHVAMNIADKKRFYNGIFRILKPGGRFAIYDIVEGNGEPLKFPVPWARTSETSFLLSAEQMTKALDEAGFIEMEWTDTTDKALAWLSNLRSRLASSPANSLSLALAMGPDFSEMAANLNQNLMEGRVRVVQAIVKRD